MHAMNEPEAKAEEPEIREPLEPIASIRSVEPMMRSDPQVARVRGVLERIADKWTLVVIEELDGQAPLRFSELKDRVPGVSQKMLSKTLRQLERDGLVTRRVHPTVPPAVDYALTPLGVSLGAALCSLWTWVEHHAEEVQAAQASFDGQRQP